MAQTADFKLLIIGSSQIVSYAIGLEQPLRYLEKQGICSYQTISEETAPGSLLPEADIVIFFRTVHPASLAILNKAQQMGKRTVYAVDDHFLAMSPATEIGKYYHEPQRMQTYATFLRQADIVKVASPYFAAHLQTHFAPRRIVYFPGSVDFQMLDKLKKPAPKANQPVKIGYEGGQKALAFAPAVQALKRIFAHYGDKVCGEFYGYIPPDLLASPQVQYHAKFIPYQSFLKRLYVSGIDIGLAPLDQSLLHACKTNNKFREYSACGIAGVYAEAPAYKDWARHRDTGMLAGVDPNDWYEAIAELVESPSLREQIARRAHIVARKHFSIDHCAKQWLQQILAPK